MENIVCVGELITDYFYQDGLLQIKEGGGTVFNIAHHLKDVCHVEVVGYTGNDEDGKIASTIAVDKQIVFLEYFKTRCTHIYVENGEHRITCPGKHPTIKEEDFTQVLHLLENTLKRLQHGFLIIDELSTYSYQYLLLANKYDFKVCLDIGYLGRIENEEISRKILEYTFFYVQTNHFMYQYLQTHQFSLHAKHSIVSQPQLISYCCGKQTIFHPVKKEITIVSQIGAGDALMAEFIKQLVLHKSICLEDGERASKKVLAILQARP